MLKRQELFKSRTRQQGLSLVELMIALAIGAALIGGVIQIFTSNNAAFRTQQSVSRMQENARFAFHFLGKELREAGYSGCSTGAKNTSVLDNTDGDKYDYMFDFDKAVEGYDHDESLPTGEMPNMSISPNNGGYEGDVVVIRRSGESQISGAEDQPNETSANFKTATAHDFEPGQILTVTNCQESYTFQFNSGNSDERVVANTGGGHTPGNTTKVNEATPKGMGSDFTVSRAMATIFYIAESSGSGEPALYRKVNDQPAEELISGVENMQLEYGLDDDIVFVGSECEIDEEGDGEVDRYETASDISDSGCEWNRVIGAKLSLLIRSESDQLRPDDYTLAFAGDDSKQFTDGRLRHVVNSTISFRNKNR